jgi:hypothetical protein
MPTRERNEFINLYKAWMMWQDMNDVTVRMYIMSLNYSYNMMKEL